MSSEVRGRFRSVEHFWDDGEVVGKVRIEISRQVG